MKCQVTTAARVDSNALREILHGLYCVSGYNPYILDADLDAVYFTDQSWPVYSLPQCAKICGRYVYIWVLDNTTTIGVWLTHDHHAPAVGWHLANIVGVKDDGTSAIVGCCVCGIFIRLQIW